MKRRFLKLAALMLALMLALTGCSLIEIDQEMDMAEAVATVNGTAITKGDVIDQYTYLIDYYSYYYDYYGLDLTAEMVADLKNDVIDMYIEQELLAQKAKELKLTDFSEESYAQADADAAEYFETLIEEHAGHVDTTGMSEEAARNAVITHMRADGITFEAVVEDYRRSYVTQLVYDYIIKDVTVTDEELQTAYNEKVAASEETYSNSNYMFELDHSNGEVVAWNPEGYRTVKHILFLLSDEQDAALSELKAKLLDVETAIKILSEDADSDAADALTAADGEQPKTLEDLNAEKVVIEKDIADKKAEIIASFSDEVQSISDRMAAGESFDSIMAELGEDPGMKNGPSVETGYYVCATSTMWDTDFRDAAMALEKVGDISEPVMSTSGVHVIYYNSDVPAGPVAMESMLDALTAEVLESKQGDVYAAQYDEWLNAATVKKYPKVLK